MVWVSRVPKMVALVMDEDLGLVSQPPEGGRMDDAVPVALEFGPRRRERLGDQTARRTRRVGRIGREVGSRVSVLHRCPDIAFFHVVHILAWDSIEGARVWA